MVLSSQLIQLWIHANSEAWYCQASNIEPVHFWLSTLKLANPENATLMFKAGGTPEDCKILASISKQILSYLEIDAEKAHLLRIECLKNILKGRPPRGMPDGSIPYLHRSETSRRLFEVATEAAMIRKAKKLSITDIIDALIDMKLVTM